MWFVRLLTLNAEPLQKGPKKNDGRPYPHIRRESLNRESLSRVREGDIKAHVKHLSSLELH